QLDELNRRLVNEIADREAIEKSSFARDNFLAAMSHEMRTPINALAATTHLLLEENPRPDQIEHLRTLQFAANNLVVFINDILDFSKIEAGKLELDWRPFSPARVLKDIEERFQVPMQEKGLQWQARFDERIPSQLIGDPVRLNQILTNLVQASYNHTEEGEIRVEMHLLELTRSEATLEVLVSGSGKGLPADLLEGMFAQRKPSEEQEDIYADYSTASLSLAITRRLIDLQKGMVEVDNRPGHGTTFRVILPFKVAEEQDQALKKTSLQPAKQDTYADLKGIRILFVEDNKLNQIVVQKLLAKLGIEVFTADDGEKALQVIEEKDFDLILMDIQMPVMDGYRTTAEIRKHPDPRKRDVPIIALTASAFLSETEKAKLFGMNDHVGKPFSPEELLAKIRSCL
ncbi:MAG: response regulator, partial [Bacteroidetes bacterium]